MVSKPFPVSVTAAAAAKSLQSCPTPCDAIDGSSPGSPVPGILQARTLEWVAISFSNAWKWKVKVKSLSCVWLFETPWTAAYQAPPPMGLSRQEYWSGVPLPSPINLSRNWLSQQFLWFRSRLMSCYKNISLTKVWQWGVNLFFCRSGMDFIHTWHNLYRFCCYCLYMQVI